MTGDGPPEGPSGFPRDDYTPHGYLQNRFDAGPWHGLGAGGPLRSVEACGFEWHLNTPRTSGENMPDRGGLQVGVRIGDALFLRPEDFTARGVALVSRYHTKSLQSFDFEHAGVRVELTFLLADRDALACRARLAWSAQRAALTPGSSSALPERGAEGGVRVPTVQVVAAARTGKRQHRNASGACRPGAVGVASESGPWHVVVASSPTSSRAFAASLEELARRLAGPEPAPKLAFDSYLDAPTVYGAATVPVDLAAGEVEVWLGLGRGATPDEATATARAGLLAAPEVLRKLAVEDAAFWERGPRLVGDWPDHWRRGWVYDLETTRLLVYPPAGVFDGPWPSWMAYYPRVVLAENTLDMLRLGQADPTLAWDALETAFGSAARAGLPNVPCLFANGVYNMVASDGSICGTSPAWCLPFHNIYLLYLMDPDRARLARIYPHLAAYLEWWLRHRADLEGWIVYKCTWEAGEDCSPRLDPQTTGHADISNVIRPVELQAAVAHSARVLARLGQELGLGADELGRWEAVYAEYRDRTRRMWDPSLGRFRDVLRATGQFSQSDATYWGRDVHHDPLQLIPLLDEIATPEQREALAEKLADFDSPPWVLWPSWSYVVAEAARAAGRRELAVRLSYGIVDRVYRENDRRSLAEHARPLPGEAREYWPLDLATWDAHEAYGWGANTLLHVLRYVVGFSPSANTSVWELELTPSLPPELAQPGRSYGLANLRYRGRRVDVELRPRSDVDVDVGLRLAPEGEVLVLDEAGQPVAVRQAGAATWFTARSFGLYRVAS